MDDKIYYCCTCAMSNHLPLRMGELVGGYCRLCGEAAPYVGHITQAEASELDIHIPSLEELSANNELR